MRTKKIKPGTSAWEFVQDMIKLAELKGNRWVMVTKQLPPFEGGAPPFMSVHYATPWPMKFDSCLQYLRRHHELDDWLENQAIASEEDKLTFKKVLLEEDMKPMPFHSGYDPNPLTTVKVRWNGNDVRLFSYEFSVLDHDKMKSFVDGGSHELVPSESNTAEERMFEEALKGEGKSFYEAALLDGATHNQALQTALGIDVDVTPGYPPIGWYRCRPEYVEHFE